MKKFTVCAVAGLCLGLALASCASSPDGWKPIDAAVEKDDFPGAVKALIEGQKSDSPIYGEKNAVSLFLDKGLLEHYAGEYAKSSESLGDAERLIREAYTKSISADAASYIANDNTKEYAGEDYENIYLNVFNALGYYHAGKLEDALVDIRRLTGTKTDPNGKLVLLKKAKGERDTKRKELNKFVVEELKKVGVTINPELPAEKPVGFSDSVLARYLSSLFYQAAGENESAFDEYNALSDAYKANPALYSSPYPQSIIDDSLTQAPEGKARINVIGFTGLSPVKEEALDSFDFTLLKVPLELMFPKNAAIIAELTEFFQPSFKLSKLTKRPSAIDKVEVIVGENKFDLVLLEDMGTAMEEIYKARYSAMVVKTYIRTLVKYAAGLAGAIKAGEEAEKKFKGMGVRAAKTAAAAALEAIDKSEAADVRMSRYFPDKAYIGGITLAPGSYTLTIKYHAGGKVLSEKQQKLEVTAGSFKLVEGFCLK
jgi:hypothetical protein